METTVTSREFLRDFARLKRAAANGTEITVRDRKGGSFVFRSKEAVPSLAVQLADLQGAISTGRPVKSPQGFGLHRR
jgi:hypothetical protein